MSNITEHPIIHHGLISIIIPVYNTASYLRQCLDSVCGQTHRDLEIICVNDGSTDNSLEILQEYAAVDRRVKVINGPQWSAGAARNAGLDVASGEYVICLDSDDFFEPNMMEVLYTKASSEKLDLVVCRSDLYIQASGKFRSAPWLVNLPLFERMEGKAFCPRQDMPNDIFQLFSGNPWNKMWNLAFVTKHNLRYQNIRNANDTFFAYAGLFLADRISYVPDILVHWREHGNSLSKGFARYPVCFVDALCALYERVMMHSEHEAVLQSLLMLVVEISQWRYLNTASESQAIVRQAIRDRLNPCTGLSRYFCSKPDEFYSNLSDTNLQKVELCVTLTGGGTSFVLPLDIGNRRARKLVSKLLSRLPRFSNLLIVETTIWSGAAEWEKDIKMQSMGRIFFSHPCDAKTYECEKQQLGSFLCEYVLEPGILRTRSWLAHEWLEKRLQVCAKTTLSPFSVRVFKHFRYPWRTGHRG